MNDNSKHTTIVSHASLKAAPDLITVDREDLDEFSNSDPNTGKYQDSSDSELLKAHVQHRCPDAFREIVLRYGPMVLSVCRRILSHNDLIEDAFQETFVILAHKGDQIRQPDLLASWLYGVARRTGLATQRKFRKRANRFVSQPSEIMSQYPERMPSAVVADESIEVALRDAVDQLPDTYRAPIVLCYFMGESHASAARMLGIPSGSISTKLRVGQEKLRSKLKRMGFVVPLVAVTWLLSQMRVEAQVPVTLISSTLVKTALFPRDIASTATWSWKLLGACRKPYLALRYLVPAILVLSALATACIVFPKFRPFSSHNAEFIQNEALQILISRERCQEH